MRISIQMLVLLSVPLFAAALSQPERDRALSHLHASRKQVLDVVTSLSDAQLQWKPAPDRWSVAECVEHLARTEDMLFGIVEKMMTKPPTPGERSPVKDEDVLAGTVDRSHKFQAPEGLRPDGKMDREALIRSFRDKRDRSIAFIRTTIEDLRQRLSPHPGFGKLDAYQWMLILAAHAERHVRQMEEIQASPGFPKH